MRIKIKIRDAFGGSHSTVQKVPVVDLDSARKYNPRFGDTLAELGGEYLPLEDGRDDAVPSGSSPD